MARVFISYARTDAARAEAVAKALERAGHQVWWDRHIQSGSRFGKQIDQELKAADAILVLWSCSSVESAWVQDEAAEGRDTNRLIPVVIDGCKPPLGFRQYQAFDISGWTGRRKLPDALLAAIATTATGASKDTNGAPGLEAGEPKPRGRGRIWAAAISLVVAAALLFGGWRYFNSDFAASSQTPTLAVLPFADLSPQRDKAYFSEGVAEEILSVLARDPGIRVIGRSSSRQFQDSSSDLQGIRKALGVTHVLEGSARTSGDELRMSVRLIDASDGSQLWAENYQRKMSNIFAVQAEIGRAVAERLSGSLSRGVREAKPQSTGVDTYALYLAARAKMRERTEPALKQALQLAKQVVAADRGYAPGHAIYTELLWLLSEHNYGNLPIDRVREVGKRHAQLAIKLAPEGAEGHAALGVLAEGEEAIAALRKAIELDPSRSELRLWLAGAYEDVGRNTEALEQHRAAVAMEPIWATAVRNMANSLAASRRYEEAERAIREFESRGGAPAQAALIRSQTAWFAGDLSRAARLSEKVARMQPDLLSSSPAHPLLYHDLGLFARAETLAGGEPRLRLYVAGKYRQLAETVKREGLWEQHHEWVGIEALALTRDWAALERFYDRRTGSAREICSDRVGPNGRIHIATALKASGRDREVAQLLGCVRKLVDLQSRGSVRPAYFPEMYLAELSAQILALEGNGPAAFREMNRAFELGTWTPHSLGLSFRPAFDPFRSTREYVELDARLKQRTAAERQQLLGP